jgi:HSP20 family protein
MRKRSSLTLKPFQEVGDIMKWPFPRFLESWGTEIIPQTPINISEMKDGYFIKAEVPGVKKEDISIDIDNDELTLKIEKREEKITEDETFYQKEIKSGSFQRTFELPADAITDHIQAQFENGILKILIPKKEVVLGERTKKIEIK